jgi:hypothetical protein
MTGTGQAFAGQAAKAIGDDRADGRRRFRCAFEAGAKGKLVSFRRPDAERPVFMNFPFPGRRDHRGFGVVAWFDFSRVGDRRVSYSDSGLRSINPFAALADYAIPFGEEMLRPWQRSG